MVNLNENEAWRRTAYLLLGISVIIGVIQRPQYQFLDELFDLFVFHIPTVMAFVIYSKVPQQ